MTRCFLFVFARALASCMIHGKVNNWVTQVSRFWLPLPSRTSVTKLVTPDQNRDGGNGNSEEGIEIAREESGAERNEANWAMAVDGWISIIDAHSLLHRFQQSQKLLGLRENGKHKGRYLSFFRRLE
jgi:hypothetical protein